MIPPIKFSVQSFVVVFISKFFFFAHLGAFLVSTLFPFVAIFTAFFLLHLFLSLYFPRRLRFVCATFRLKGTAEAGLVCGVKPITYSTKTTPVVDVQCDQTKIAKCL